MSGSLTARAENGLDEVIVATNELDDGMIGSVYRVHFDDGSAVVAKTGEHDAAAHLASLHAIEGRACGFPFDTLTGPVHQPNPWTDEWIAFYRDTPMRLHRHESREEMWACLENQGYATE